uniref:Uncharacterized protein n=1 Tax=Picea glauca TaxID=3330 RepID=A0A101LUX8_PICGL|nr:hypothetical protein ABT39_MTgene2183 [Picea glauca]
MGWVQRAHKGKPYKYSKEGPRLRGNSTSFETSVLLINKMTRPYIIGSEEPTTDDVEVNPSNTVMKKGRASVRSI